MKAYEADTRRYQTSTAAIAVHSLPTDLAIKRVKGEGSREAAIMADPDCPFCVKCEEPLREVEDVTIYTASRSRTGLQHVCRELRFCDDSAE